MTLEENAVLSKKFLDIIQVNPIAYIYLYHVESDGIIFDMDALTRLFDVLSSKQL